VVEGKILGKARALKLGIVKGVRHAASEVAKNVSWKCPVCKTKFNAYDLKKQAVEEGEEPETILARHVELCIRSQFPGYKSACGICTGFKDPWRLDKSEMKFTMDELQEHMRIVHGHADSPDSNSVDAASSTSAGDEIGEQSSDAATLRESEYLARSDEIGKSGKE